MKAWTAKGAAVPVGAFRAFVITSEESVSKGIRRIVALTGVAASAAMSSAANLDKQIDRARTLEEKLEVDEVKHLDDIHSELKRLRQRGRIVNTSMILLTLSAVSIGATVMGLFLVETVASSSSAIVPWTFLGGVFLFVLALLCFWVETLLAGKSLNFGRRGHKKHPN